SGLNAKGPAPPFRVREARSCPLARSHSLISPLVRPFSSRSPLPKEARVLPSGLNARKRTNHVWPLREARSCPLARSHSLISPDQRPEARVWPSGLNAKEPTSPSRMARTCPLARSHNLTVLPSHCEKRVLPSGLNANEKTWFVWPLREKRACPV